MNLEAQIGHASDMIASRDQPNDASENTIKGILNKLENLANKLNAQPPSSHPYNNIVINSCQAVIKPPDAHSQSTQTYQAGALCTCFSSSSTETNPNSSGADHDQNRMDVEQDHTANDSVHQQPEQIHEPEHVCDQCGETSNTAATLLQHKSEKHPELSEISQESSTL